MIEIETYKRKYPAFYLMWKNNNTIEVVDYCLDLILDMRKNRGCQYTYNSCITTLKMCSFDLQ